MYSIGVLPIAVILVLTESRGTLQNEPETSEDVNEITHTGGLELHSQNLSYGQTYHELVSSTRECSTWMYRTNASEECICGVNNYHTVKCDHGRVYVLDSYRMTYDEELQDVVVGPSIYGIVTPNSYDIYHIVPMNKSQLNQAMCGQFSRRGRLCGACKEGYSPLVYSYSLHCKQCSESENRYNILKYAGITVIPLTIFYVITLLFKLNANSPALHGYILYAQLFSSPFALRIFLANSYNQTVGVQVFATLYGIWNLDFFRTLYPDMCLKITTLQALSLDYLIAFYPLLLIFLTCIAFKLHSQGYKIMIVISTIVQKCLSLFRKESLWSERASMTSIFATFLLLSYGRIMSVSINLLIYTPVISQEGKFVGNYLYYDASYEFFGKEHLPYGILALVLLTCFNILPFLLLIFYPMKWFQRCLNHLNLSHITLHTFVDSFAGCYKDGTEPGTRDCRYFAGLYLFMRMFFFIVYAVTLTNYFFDMGAIIATGILLLYVLFEPYKAKYAVYNKIVASVMVLIIMSILSAGSVVTAENKMYRAIPFSIALLGITLALPQLYITIMAIKWTGICKLKCFRPLFSRVVQHQDLESPSEESLLIVSSRESQFTPHSAY